MKREKKEKHFIQKPSYPGGVKAMQEFLRKNKKYPKEALKHKIEGTVSIRYTINHQGNVVKTKVVAGLGYGCDGEAQRIVGLLKFEIPKTRKLRVLYHKTVHIHFKLPKKTKQETKIVYTSSEQKKNDQEKPSSGSYSYKIEW